MYRIVKKEALKPTVTLYEIEAPMVALGQRLTQRPRARASVATEAGKREVPLSTTSREHVEAWQLIHRH